MAELKFSLKTYNTEMEAYSAFEKAKKLLTEHEIPFRMDIANQEFFVTTDYTGKMTTSRVYKLMLDSESDLTAYNLIKD